jgi:hypothetical protein
MRMRSHTEEGHEHEAASVEDNVHIFRTLEIVHNLFSHIFLAVQEEVETLRVHVRRRHALEWRQELAAEAEVRQLLVQLPPLREWGVRKLVLEEDVRVDV